MNPTQRTRFWGCLTQAKGVWKWQALSITIFVVQCLPFLVTAIRAAMEYCMRFHLVTVVMMKIKILKNMTPCRLVKSYLQPPSSRQSKLLCSWTAGWHMLINEQNFRSLSDMQTVSEGIFSDLREGRFLKTHNLPVASVPSEAFSLCISHHQETAAEWRNHLLFSWNGDTSVFRRVRKIEKSDYYLRHVCPSVCTHGITWRPICRENSIYIKSWQEQRVLYKKIFFYIYDVWTNYS